MIRLGRRMLLAVVFCAASVNAQEMSLQLGGKEVPIAGELRLQLDKLAREMFSRCGPNTLQHPGNFGLAAIGVEERWKRTLSGSRLRIVFGEPFITQSHLGGTLGVTEALVGLESQGFFVGPNFTRHGGTFAEHLQCEYLPALELACLPGMLPHLPASYRETCAKFERGPDGRIVLPPPDIAPSCS